MKDPSNAQKPAAPLDWRPSTQSLGALTAYCPLSTFSVFKRSIVITTPDLTSGTVRRPAVTLLLSLDNSPFSLTVNGVRVDRARAVVVGDLKARSLQAVGCELASINVEPGHPLFVPLRQMCASGFRVLRSDALAAWRDHLRAQFLSTQPSEPESGVLVALLAPHERLNAINQIAQSNSRREDLLAMFETLWPHQISTRRMASGLHLSASRLSHLFVEDVGVPLRTYALWRRHRYALENLRNVQSLTELALESGFSDAAHMTRTFVSYFGFPPKAFRQSSRILVHGAATAQVPAHLFAHARCAIPNLDTMRAQKPTAQRNAVAK